MMVLSLLSQAETTKKLVFELPNGDATITSNDILYKFDVNDTNRSQYITIDGLFKKISENSSSDVGNVIRTGNDGKLYVPKIYVNKDEMSTIAAEDNQVVFLKDGGAYNQFICESGLEYQSAKPEANAIIHEANSTTCNWKRIRPDGLVVVDWWIPHEANASIDDAPYINKAFDYARSITEKTGTTAVAGDSIQIVFARPDYYIKTPINATGMRLNFKKKYINFGSSVFHATNASEGFNDKAVIDFTGSRVLSISGGRIEGDETYPPFAGVLFARDSSELAAGTHNVIDTEIVGFYSKAALALVGAEVNKFSNMKIRNASDSNTSYSIVLSNQNMQDFNTTNEDGILPRKTVSSFVMNVFSGCDIRKGPVWTVNTGDMIWVDSAKYLRFERNYFSIHNGSLFYVYETLDNNPLEGLYVSSHVETDGMDKNDSSTGVQSYFTFDKNDSLVSDTTLKLVNVSLNFDSIHAQDNIFNIANSNISKVEIYGDVSFGTIPRDVNQSIFDDVSKYELYGNMRISEATDFFNADGLTYKGTITTPTEVNSLSDTVSRVVATTANGGNGTNDGAGTWAKLATINLGTDGKNDVALLYSLVGSTGDQGVVLFNIKLRQDTSGIAFTDIKIISNTTKGIDTDGIMLFAEANAYGEDIDLYIQKNAINKAYKLYELSKNSQKTVSITTIIMRIGTRQNQPGLWKKQAETQHGQRRPS